MSQLTPHEARLEHAYELLHDEFVAALRTTDPLTLVSWHDPVPQLPIAEVVAELIAANPALLTPLLYALMHAAEALEDEPSQLVLAELGAQYASAYLYRLEALGVFNE
jgi:hypothetical protein